MRMSLNSLISAKIPAKRRLELATSSMRCGYLTFCEYPIIVSLFLPLTDGFRPSMKRVEAAVEWSLFSPDEAPGLYDSYGTEFEELYERYEREGRARKTIPAQKLWYAILDAQIETGGPFMCYKDHANRKFHNEVFKQSLSLLQENPTRRTLVQSSRQISARKSCNTPLQTRLLSAILPRLHCLRSSEGTDTTSRSYTMSQRSSRST